MLRDTEFFKSRLGKLDGSAEIGDQLVNIVNAKVVAGRGEPLKEAPADTDGVADESQESVIEEKA